MRENNVDVNNSDVVGHCLQKELQDCIGKSYYEYERDMMQNYYRLKPMQTQLHMLPRQQMEQFNQAAQQGLPLCGVGQLANGKERR